MDTFKKSIQELTKDEIINDYKKRKQRAIMDFIEVWDKATRMDQNPSLNNQLENSLDYSSGSYEHFIQNTRVHERSSWNYNQVREDASVFLAKSLNVSYNK